MIRPIVLWPDPVLARVAAEITVFDTALAALAADMLETMYAAPGRGLAGPQVGVSQRLFVMDVTWKDGTPAPRVMVNPQVMTVSKERRVNDEGCLSLPGFTAPVERPAEVTLRWQGLDGAVQQERLTGFSALCALHEYDHLDGILTIDRTPDPASLEPALAALRVAS